MLEQLVLGAIQGITEWLPISSESIILLVKANVFNTGNEAMLIDLPSLLRLALFLHLGTFFAALVYLRKDVVFLLGALFNPSSFDNETNKVLKFLIIVTIISGTIGFFILSGISSIENNLNITSQYINLLIGLMLLVTGLIQLGAGRNKGKLRSTGDIKSSDSVLLGLMQGLAIIPGLSRSGLTISALLLRRFDDTQALKLSFLMSLPIVLAGNIILNLKDFSFHMIDLVGLTTSFVFGILTIHFLLSITRKINFGYFVLIFGSLVLASLAF
jgi:undecaprenyl-diphosphatase